MATSSPDVRGKNTIVESMKQLCLSGKFSDVTFVFGKGTGNAGRLQAHRNVLSARSPVFEAMLYGPLSGESGAEIQIKDTDQKTFQKFLRFMYTDEIDLDGDSILKILYLANKYNLEILEERCCTFLETSIYVDNVCTIHEHAGIFGRRELQEKCFDFILFHNDEVLQSQNFLSISKETLGKILSADSLSANEVSIFEAAARWAVEQCKKNEVAETSTNIREQLGDTFYCIRFPLVPTEMFAKEICPRQILTTAEENQLFRYMVTAGDTAKPHAEKVGRFLARTRKGAEITVRLQQSLDNRANFYSRRQTKIQKKRALSAYRHTQTGSVYLNVNPSCAIKLKTIVCKGGDFEASSINFITVSGLVDSKYYEPTQEKGEDEYSSEDEYEEDLAKKIHPAIRVEYELRGNQIVFKQPIKIERKTQITFNWNVYVATQDNEIKQNFSANEINVTLEYSPGIFNEVIFLR